jgi:hypothetical protein
MKPDKISISLGLLIIFMTYSWISSCTHQPDPNSLPTICYKEVKTIIGSNCFKAQTLNTQGCHDNTGEGPDFSTDQGIQDAVTAGDADASALYQAIITVRGESKMPPNLPPIPQESRTTVRIWIEQGAKTDACPDDVAILNKGNNKLFNK